MPRGEKIIYKNNEEHISPITHTDQIMNFIVTENTIYVIHAIRMEL